MRCRSAEVPGAVATHPARTRGTRRVRRRRLRESTTRPRRSGRVVDRSPQWPDPAHPANGEPAHRPGGRSPPPCAGRHSRFRVMLVRLPARRHVTVPGDTAPAHPSASAAARARGAPVARPSSLLGERRTGVSRGRGRSPEVRVRRRRGLPPAGTCPMPPPALPAGRYRLRLRACP